MATPAITLVATLQDFSGDDLGSAANPCGMLITLCGFGSALPRIYGTAMLARVGPMEIQSTGGEFSVDIWGNDVILPSTTYYEIALVDAQGNIVQSGLYLLTGSGTIDLSTLLPLVNQPGGPTPIAFIGYEVLPYTPTLDFNGLVANVFDVTLTGNVTSSTAENFPPGQFVQFFIQQDGVGGHTFAWPTTVKNPPLVDAGAGKTTTAFFCTRIDGNLYPVLGWS